MAHQALAAATIGGYGYIARDAAAARDIPGAIERKTWQARYSRLVPGAGC